MVARTSLLVLKLTLPQIELAYAMERLIRRASDISVSVKSVSAETTSQLRAE